MRSKGPIEITERDRKIFQFLFEHRALTYGQVQLRFFSSAKQQTANHRLSRLVKEGYLSKSGANLHGRLTMIYGLTPKGLKEAGKNYRFEITQPLYKSDSILHDIGVADVRSRLERTKMLADYFSENMLQSCGALANSEKFRSFSRVHADAGLVLEVPGKQFRVALEYEASEKELERYSKKLTEYYFSPDIVAVFYICRNGRIENVIRQVDAEVGQKFEPKIYTCLENVIHQEALPIPFKDRKNATFLLS